MRTYRRWYRQGEVQADKRPACARPEPANKLSQQERDAIIEVCNSPEFASLPPTQIVPTLLDKGEYIASESSYYRVLGAQGQLNNRGRQRTRQKQAKMDELGITSSYSRPIVSDDNPYVESLFRTVKYMPSWPIKGFETLDSSRSWVEAFVRWYNTEHKHSKLNYVTPSQRHNGKDKEILKRRGEVLLTAKQLKPECWPSDIRNCKPVGEVHLNPEREAA